MIAIENATRRVALVTCAELPELDPDTKLLEGPLGDRDVFSVAVVWDDPHVYWPAFDLAVVRSCWDYQHCREDFVAWARKVPRLANSAEVIDWNTDKRYLDQLAVRHIPVVPTVWVPPGEIWTPPREGEWVVKPAVSLAGLDTGRYYLARAAERRLASGHIRRLHRSGRTAMVQPYLTAVDEEGETSLVYLGGEYSHAVRRATTLHGPDTGVDRRFLPGAGSGVRPERPGGDQVALADRVLDALPFDASDLLYARVDLATGDDGDPVLIELELTEPELFLGYAPGAADRMADAILRTAGRTAGRTTVLG